MSPEERARIQAQYFPGEYEQILGEQLAESTEAVNEQHIIFVQNAAMLLDAVRELKEACAIAGTYSEDEILEEFG